MAKKENQEEVSGDEMNVAATKYGVFDETGRPSGFYSSDISPPPEGAVELTEDQWLEFINNDGARAFVKGEVVEIEPLIPAITWDSVRRHRNALLAASDWTQLNDAPLDESKINAWKAYRQALRDLPENSEDPAAVVWPDLP